MPLLALTFSWLVDGKWPGPPFLPHTHVTILPPMKNQLSCQNITFSPFRWLYNFICYFTGAETGAGARLLLRRSKSLRMVITIVMVRMVSFSCLSHAAPTLTLALLLLPATPAPATPPVSPASPPYSYPGTTHKAQASTLRPFTREHRNSLRRRRIKSRRKSMIR